MDDRRLGEEKNHTEVLKDKLGAYRLEPVPLGCHPLCRGGPRKRTRAQELCARHKAIATADHQGMPLGSAAERACGARVAAHYAFEHKRDEIRGLHYWQGQRRCGAVYANTAAGQHLLEAAEAEYGHMG